MNTRRLAYGSIFPVLLAFGASGASAQPSHTFGVVDGIVTDTNLVTLSAATVSILGSKLSVATAENGRFRIVGLHGGNYILAIHRIGYVPIAVAVSVVEGDTLRPSFELQRITTELDTMIVTAKSITARMNEFESRRKVGVGYFITADDLEKRNTILVADVIRTVPSVEINTGGMFASYAVNTRNHFCQYQLYLDGMPMPIPTDLNVIPRPSQLAGIEIYSGPATVPPIYAGLKTTCGVILFWTKTGD